jgi:hypothetical protein
MLHVKGKTNLVKISEDIAFSFNKEIYMKYLILRFAHSPKNVIFLLGRLIFSVSINSRVKLYLHTSRREINKMAELY